MKKRIKNKILLLLTGILVLLTPMTAFAESSSNYSMGSGAEEYKVAPVAYEVDKVYHAVDIEGVESLDGLASMFVKGDSVYVATSSAILILDLDFTLKETLAEYTDLDGKTAQISGPDGLFVTDSGLLYVCEPTKEHVLVFDSSLKLVQSFGKPEGLDVSVKYQPSQIIVDSLNRMYIIASNIYEGILEVSSDNKFQRYFGTTTVSVSPIEIFFRAIASEAQLSRQALLLPTEYSSMTVNGRGFVYTTIRSRDVETPVRLLNVNGDDIMPKNWQDNPPSGDENYANSGQYGGKSSLSYIDCNEYGMYMVLDTIQNRIFTYDSSSNVLFVFGGRGDKDGCFRNPVSIRWMGESNKVLVADRLSQSITVMKPTNYAAALFEAAKLEAEGERDAAVAYWQKALDMNYNCNVAKDAIGRVRYWNGDYKGSQEMLGQILRNDYYSMAFEKTREQMVRTYAPAAVVVLVVLIVAVKLLKRVRRSKKGGNGNAA